MKRLLAILAPLLLLAASAHAALTETTYNKYNQTTSIASHQMFDPASPYTGNYQFSITLNGNGGACDDSVTVTVGWTDEQGAQSQNVHIDNSENAAGRPCELNPFAEPDVFMVRALASTPVTVTVTLGDNGGINPIYNLSVDAIGF